MKTETVEQFLARGGVIQKIPEAKRDWGIGAEFEGDVYDDEQPMAPVDEYEFAVDESLEPDPAFVALFDKIGAE